MSRKPETLPNPVMSLAAASAAAPEAVPDVERAVAARAARGGRLGALWRDRGSWHRKVKTVQSNRACFRLGIADHLFPAQVACTSYESIPFASGIYSLGAFTAGTWMLPLLLWRQWVMLLLHCQQHTMPNGEAKNVQIRGQCWVLEVKGFSLSYHNKETLLFTIDPYYGNLI